MDPYFLCSCCLYPDTGAKKGPHCIGSVSHSPRLEVPAVDGCSNGRTSSTDGGVNNTEVKTIDTNSNTHNKHQLHRRKSTGGILAKTGDLQSLRAQRHIHRFHSPERKPREDTQIERNAIERTPHGKQVNTGASTISKEPFAKSGASDENIARDDDGIIIFAREEYSAFPSNAATSSCEKETTDSMENLKHDQETADILDGMNGFEENNREDDDVVSCISCSDDYEANGHVSSHIPFPYTADQVQEQENNVVTRGNPRVGISGRRRFASISGSRVQISCKENTAIPVDMLVHKSNVNHPYFIEMDHSASNAGEDEGNPNSSGQLSKSLTSTPTYIAKDFKILRPEDLYIPRGVPRTTRTYIFGYGSLINPQSRLRTMPEPVNAIPVIVKNLHRSWSYNCTCRSYTAVGVRRHKGALCNGVLVPINNPEKEIPRLDEREKDYVRRRICPQDILLLNSFRHFIDVEEDVVVWVYELGLNKPSVSSASECVVGSDFRVPASSIPQSQAKSAVPATSGHTINVCVPKGSLNGHNQIASPRPDGKGGNSTLPCCKGGHGNSKKGKIGLPISDSEEELDETKSASSSLTNEVLERPATPVSSVGEPTEQTTAESSGNSRVVYVEAGEHVPTLQVPIPQTYVDCILAGCMMYGRSFAEAFVKTTCGWDGVWVNDRHVHDGVKRYVRCTAVGETWSFEEEELDHVLSKCTKGAFEERLPYTAVLKNSPSLGKAAIACLKDN